MDTSTDRHLPISTASDFRRRAKSVLHAAPPDAVFDPRSGKIWERGDWDLNPEMLADFAVMEPARAAAVLVPIVARDPLTVLLTQRTSTLASHAGQVAFPGGKVDPEDPDPVHTALREAEEEIGLDRRYVEPLGFLDNYRTGTGYLVMPVVALVEPGFTLTLESREVDDAFEVPLSFLLDERNHQKHARPWRGRDRHYYAMPFEDRYIWGATAGMIRNLHERLFAQ